MLCRSMSVLWTEIIILLAPNFGGVLKKHRVANIEWDEESTGDFSPDGKEELKDAEGDQLWLLIVFLYKLRAVFLAECRN